MSKMRWGHVFEKVKCWNKVAPENSIKFVDTQSIFDTIKKDRIKNIPAKYDKVAKRSKFKNRW